MMQFRVFEKLLSFYHSCTIVIWKVYKCTQAANIFIFMATSFLFFFFFT